MNNAPYIEVDTANQFNAFLRNNATPSKLPNRTDYLRLISNLAASVQEEKRNIFGVCGNVEVFVVAAERYVREVLEGHQHFPKTRLDGLLNLNKILLNLEEELKLQRVDESIKTRMITCVSKRINHYINSKPVHSVHVYARGSEINYDTARRLPYELAIPLLFTGCNQIKGLLSITTINPHGIHHLLASNLHAAIYFAITNSPNKQPPHDPETEKKSALSHYKLAMKCTEKMSAAEGYRLAEVVHKRGLARLLVT